MDNIDNHEDNKDKRDKRIISKWNIALSLQSAERAAFRRSNSTGGRGPGRPPITDIPLEELFAAEDSVCSYHYYFHCASSQYL